MIKYENSTKNIYPKYQTFYRYRSSCWLRVSCQQNRSRKRWKDNWKLTKCVFRSWFQRTKYVFTSKDHCNVHQLFIVTSLPLLLPVIQTIFFGAEIFNPQKKKSAKIKCLLFRPKPQKFHTTEITGYTVVLWNNRN